jgi:hypothetical protein
MASYLLVIKAIQQCELPLLGLSHVRDAVFGIRAGDRGKNRRDGIGVVLVWKRDGI